MFYRIIKMLTSCFPASLKTYCSSGFNRNCTLFRFHHSLFPTEYIHTDAKTGG
jgi:hypothetical protein